MEPGRVRRVGSVNGRVPFTLGSPGAGALGTGPAARCPRTSHRWAFIQTEAPAGLALPGPLGSPCLEHQVSRVANLKEHLSAGALHVRPAQEVGLAGGRWGPAAGCGQSLPGFPATLPPASPRPQASWWPRGLAPLLNGLFLFVLFLVNPWVSCPVPSLNTLHLASRGSCAGICEDRVRAGGAAVLCALGGGGCCSRSPRPAPRPAPALPPAPRGRGCCSGAGPGGGRLCPRPL